LLIFETRKKASTILNKLCGIFDPIRLGRCGHVTVGVNQLRPLLDALPFTKPIEVPPPIPIQMYFTFPLVLLVIMLAFSVYDSRKNICIVNVFAYLTLASLLAGVTLAGILHFTFRENSRLTFLVFLVSTYILWCSGGW
jgi:hypothetical protein